jgi:glycosyltransferase involved in cell wall biosynthesis
MKEEEKTPLSIRGFDEDAYIEANLDVKLAIERDQFRSALHHLELYGLEEIKQGLRGFHKDCDLFDEYAYRERFGDIEDAIESGVFEDGFSHFCCNGYQEIMQGKRPWSTHDAIDPEQKERDDLDIYLQSMGLSQNDIHIYHTLLDFGEEIDWLGYGKLMELEEDDDPILHYMLHYFELRPIIPNFFDTHLYMSIYPDIESSGINPLFHYLTNGREEGRVGCISEEDYLERGGFEEDLSKPTLVVVTHESSATGAPLLGLNIARSLANSYNIIQVILKKSVLHDQFVQDSTFTLNNFENKVSLQGIFRWLNETKSIEAALCNSVETLPLLKFASELRLPTLSLIHEFSDYTRPIGKLSEAVFYADRVIVPAKIIQDSISSELKKFFNIKGKLNHFTTLPQGKLPYIPKSHGEDLSMELLRRKLGIIEDTKVVMGAGFVHMRKGVDLFLSMAKYVKDHYKGRCKFIWVGGGFDPDHDLTYSVWLQKQMEALELEQSFAFLEHQKSLDNLFEIADIFALTSRLDPFPNVVVDALASDTYVTCFEKSTGCAEFLKQHQANSSVVPYLDTSAMGEAIVEYLKQDARQIEGINRTIVKRALDFDRYIDALEEHIEEAIRFNRESQVITNELLESDAFYGDFFSFLPHTREGCQFYVKTTQKGIFLKNPRPGFSDKRWLYQEGGEGVVPLYEALKQKRMTTHRCEMIPFETTQSIDFFYAVHLHLFYIDLGEEFASYFRMLPGKFDILVTIVDEEQVDLVKEIFAPCGAHAVKVYCVKNIGRDIGPLYFDLRDDILEHNYDVVGHFHSKKSFDIENGVGNRWRRYLLENLIGSQEVARSVLSLFSEAKVGLVFPEDAHPLDMGENRPYIEDLASMLHLEVMQDASLFPVGNMFWVRVDAIKKLFELEASKVLEEEPLPYDGSYMHALERFITHVVESRGYEIATVYKEGTRW